MDELGNITRRGTTMRTRARELRRNMTEAERVLWVVLRRKQLRGIRFYRQVAIDRFIADFYCPRKRLVVEVDGAVHEEKGQREYDKARDIFLRKKDMRIMRVKNEEVMDDLEGVLRRIARACRRPLP